MPPEQKNKNLSLTTWHIFMLQKLANFNHLSDSDQVRRMIDNELGRVPVEHQRQWREEWEERERSKPPAD